MKQTKIILYTNFLPLEKLTKIAKFTKHRSHLNFRYFILLFILRKRKWINCV